MPERQQAAIADQEVEGAGQQRKAQRLHHEERIDTAHGHERQQHRHHGEHDYLVAHGARGYWQCVVSQCCSYQAARPVSPVGFTSNTSTIRTNTTVLEASG